MKKKVQKKKQNKQYYVFYRENELSGFLLYVMENKVFWYNGWGNNWEWQIDKRDKSVESILNDEYPTKCLIIPFQDFNQIQMLKDGQLIEFKRIIRDEFYKEVLNG